MQSFLRILNTLPDGTQISTVKAIGGVASQAVSSYSVVIAKIGRLTIKIAVK